MSFFPCAPTEISATALILNILVSGTSSVAYKKAGHFRGPLLYPFLISSIPLAFIGGMIQLSLKMYSLLLAGTLVFAAARLNMRLNPETENEPRRAPKFWPAIFIGAVIGVISGMIGIGGGIFLSPILMLAHWASPKETAAVSAPFILINSIAGLIGRVIKGKFVVGLLLPFVISAFLGGCLGSYLGANRFTNLIVRRVLGLVLILAAFKLLRTAAGV